MGRSVADKIGRDAFLFMEPISQAENEDFAQCGPCRMFVPESYLDIRSGTGRCILHGSDVEVDDDDSCGLFARWPDGKPDEQVIRAHAAELMNDIPGSVTAEESGLVSREVQCHRCDFEKNGATLCGLFEELNRKLPEFFDLDTKIEQHSCCNAQEPKGKSRESDSKDLRNVIIMAVRGSSGDEA
jgi:hypothetical protein